MDKRQTYDKERVSWNVARIKKGGGYFEVVIDPDAALDFKRNSGELHDVLKSEKIFSDAKRGLLASDEKMKELFGTDDVFEIAKRIILEGELQLSADHRAKLREEKRNRIVSHIQMYAIDPKTGLPHPAKRIALAMEEAKVKIDDKKDVESQISGIVKKIQPVIPIRLETVTLQVKLPAQYGQKLYGDLQRFGTINKSDWLSDGGLLAWLELPAGLQNDLIDSMGAKTHGTAEIKRVEENPLER